MRIARRVSVSLLAAALMGGAGNASGESKLPVHDGVGGEFSAESSLGRKVSLSEFRGKVVLLFFGYTSCPDACPANLSHLKALVKRLGPAAKDVQVLLVTVDPENDTPERLSAYLARFDSRFVGLTGDREETDHIIGLFLGTYEKSAVQVTTEHNRTGALVERSHLYAHSQQIYLLDKSGRTRALFFTGTPLDEMEEAVLALRAERPGGVRAEGVEHAPRAADCNSLGNACPRDPNGDHAHEGAEKDAR